MKRATKRALSKVTQDVAATVTGLVLAGAASAADAYVNHGAPSDKVLVASAIIGAAGWWFKRGNSTPLAKGE